MMTDAEIEAAIAEIEWSAKRDDEEAHIEQDRLYVEFIRHVAESGIEPLASQARRVLSVESIDFSRWYA